MTFRDEHNAKGPNKIEKSGMRLSLVKALARKSKSKAEKKNTF